ncbi:uncharacterized protein METZ01_LOCUS241953 [marine metagenome]|uniref:Uncharacterized protein n=1 Tax=marine metagenome TaxID=408172 RepID=A0A382HPF2_9ZZZZ
MIIFEKCSQQKILFEEFELKGLSFFYY